MIGGTLLISLGACDVAARIFDSLMRGDQGLWLRFGGDVEALAAAVTILVGGCLLLDYCQKSEK